METAMLRQTTTRRILIACALWVLASASAWAQPFEVSWWTVDGGGVTGAVGGTFGLDATAGQPDAGGPFTGAPYALRSGFWAFVDATGAVVTADLAVTKTDGQATAVPGLPVTYTIVARNLGPDAVTTANVSDPLPPALTGASWACTASPGSGCPPSGTGGIDAAVSLAANGTATFTLTATVAPTATGTLVNTASVTPPPGASDPIGANDAATDTDALVPSADLGISIADAPDPVAAGASLRYTLSASNLGPSASAPATLASTLPSSVTFVSATPGCAHAAGVVTCALGALDAGAGAVVTVDVNVPASATGVLTNATSIAGATADPVGANNSDIETTQVLVVRARAELVDGFRLVRDLRSVGGAAGQDLYRISQKPYSSYEVVVDAASGDLGNGQGPRVERVAVDGVTVLASSVPVGTGPARSLRIVNQTASPIDDQLVRVRSAACSSDCGTDDTYRLRARETTASIPRFNNTGSQLTVLLLQNRTAQAVNGRAYFWSPAGGLLHQEPVVLAPHALQLVNTFGIVALQGQGGSVTVAHDGPLDAIAGKAVALEPATGFSFDSPLGGRP
jgi:uncharacterized repeat protein (TIGR01451 family)